MSFERASREIFGRHNDHNNRFTQLLRIMQQEAIGGQPLTQGPLVLFSNYIKRQADAHKAKLYPEADSSTPTNRIGEL